MENIKVKEYLKIKIDHYPFYKSLNKKIIEDVKTLSFYPSQNFQYTNIKGTQHNFKLGREPDNIKLILQWITNLIPSFDFNPHTERVISLGSSWLAKYNRGDYVIKHTHQPSTISFVYFVRSPRGSSPLVFTTSGKRINSEEGRVVLFPGNLIHHVPKNKCDDRITYAGNFTVNSPGH